METMDEIWEDVKTGTRLLNSNKETEAIMVLGLPGSGKSTIASLVTKYDLNPVQLEPSINPSAFFPEMMEDEDEGTIYYDCPSFGESSDPKTDMISTYLMNKLINELPRIKFLFTIDYSYVKRVDQRDNFINWMKQVQKIMKNVESFGLVVTEIEDQSYDEIVREIKHFLETVNKLIERDEYDWIFKNYAAKLMDNILQEQNHCSKLSVVRRSKELEDKIQIKGMMKDCVEFSLKKDFAYTISDRTQDEVIRLVDQIHQSTNVGLGILASDIKRHFEDERVHFYDVYKLLEDLSEGFEQVDLAVSEIHESMTFQDLGNQLQNSLENMNGVSGGYVIAQLFLQDEYLEFLGDVSSREFQIVPSKFESSLVDVRNYLQEVREYYITLVGEYPKLWGYNAQNAKLNHPGAKMLRAAIEDKGSTIRTAPGELKVIGSFVKTSQIDWNDKTKNSIKIFARQKVFVDSDLLLTSPGSNVSIISPNWEIVGNREIVFRWFDFEETPRFGFLGIGENFVNGQNLVIDGRSKGLSNNERELKNVNMIPLGGAELKYRNVEPKVDSKTCTLGFRPNYGVRFATAEGYEPESPTWDPSGFKAKTINEYKDYLMNQKSSPMNYRTTVHMLQALDRNACVENFYDVHGIIDDFLKLEIRFDWERREEFIPMYESLVKKVGIRAKNTGNADERKILTTVYAAALSKYWSLRNYLGGNLIIDVEKQFEDLERRLEGLTKDEKTQETAAIAEEYEEQVRTEIAGMQGVIMSSILPDIKKISLEISERMRGFKKEIEDLKEGIRVDIKVKEAQREKMKLNFGLGVLMTVIQTGAKIAGAFSSTGAVMSTAVDIGVDVGNQLIGDSSGAPSSFSLPSGVVNGLAESIADGQDYLDAGDDVDLDNLQVASEMMSEGGGGLIVDTVGIANTVKDLVELRREAKAQKNDRAKSEVKGKIRELKTKVRGAAEKELKSKSKTTKSEKIGRGIQAATAGVGGIIEIWKSAVNHEEALKALDDAMKEDKTNLDELAKYGNYLKDQLTPYLEDMNGLVGESSTMSDKSRAKFNEQKWNTQKIIRDIQIKMESVMAGFQAQTDVVSAYHRLRDTMDSVANVYRQIHAARERKELVNALKKIDEAASGEGQFWLHNKELSKTLKMIQYQIRYNIAFGEYNRLVRGLGMMKFPFAEYFLSKDIEVPRFRFEETETKASVGRMLDRVKSLQTNLANFKSGIKREVDDVMIFGPFPSRGSLRNPFYVWKNRDYKRDIEKLLTGEEIVLVADVGKGRHENAVKFNKIELVLTASNKKIEEEIDQILLNFDVSLIHSGVSRYKCGNKCYAIVRERNKLDYGYDQEEKSMSLAYKKIINVKPILSPYTSWTMKLTKKRDPDGTGFDELEKYKDRVNLELAGEGSYVKQNSSICYSGLDRYYKVDFVEKTHPGRRNRREIRNNPFVPESRRNVTSNFGLDGNILLFDLCVRKLTGSKIDSMGAESKEIDFPKVCAESVNLAIKCERLFEKYYHEDISFDALGLMGLFRENFLKGGPKESRIIARNFIVKNYPAARDPGFFNELEYLLTRY